MRLLTTYVCCTLRLIFFFTCVSACDCSMIGTVTNSSCDKDSGMCLCKRYVTGERCDTCYVSQSSGNNKKWKKFITSHTQLNKNLHTICLCKSVLLVTRKWYMYGNKVLGEKKKTSGNTDPIFCEYFHAIDWILHRVRLLIILLLNWNSYYIDTQLKISNC